MAKLVCAISFLVLCGYSHIDPTPDLNGASMRLALAVIFAATLVAIVRAKLEELIG